MLTYAEAREKLGNRTKRKLERNTYLEPLDAQTVAVRLHQTNVVLIHSNGTYTLNSGGWKTITTKARINEYSPARLYSENNVWYVGETGYTDGMKVDSTGGLVSGGHSGHSQAILKRRLDKMVLKYVKGFCEWVAENKDLPVPSGGDAWPALIGEPDATDPLGGMEPMGLDYLFDTFKDEYYIPSLVWKALNTLRYGNPGLAYVMMQGDAKRGDTRMLRRTLLSYFRKRKPALLELLQGRSAA